MGYADELFDLSGRVVPVTGGSRGLGRDLEAVAESARRHALRRVGQPAEVVGAALYLISDASSYTSAATLRVDGGIP